MYPTCVSSKLCEIILPHGTSFEPGHSGYPGYHSQLREGGMEELKQKEMSVLWFVLYVVFVCFCSEKN